MPVRSIIVDTSALYALVDADDAHHREAVSYLKRAGRDASLVLADTTLMEALTRIGRRLGRRTAARTLRSILQSQRFRVIRLTDQDYEETWRIFEQYADKDWSPFDCACLAVARSRKIQEAFAFDAPFEQMASAGLLRVPSRA